MFRTAVRVVSLLLVTLALPLMAKDAANDPRLKNSFRRPEKNGWTFVHLEGTPAEIGFQNGYLLARRNRGHAESDHARDRRTTTKKTGSSSATPPAP